MEDADRCVAGTGGCRASEYIAVSLRTTLRVSGACWRQGEQDGEPCSFAARSLHRSLAACRRVFLVQRAFSLSAGVGSPTGAGTGRIVSRKKMLAGCRLAALPYLQARRGLNKLLQIRLAYQASRIELGSVWRAGRRDGCGACGDEWYHLTTTILIGGLPWIPHLPVSSSSSSSAFCSCTLEASFWGSASVYGENRGSGRSHRISPRRERHSDLPRRRGKSRLSMR